MVGGLSDNVCSTNVGCAEGYYNINGVSSTDVNCDQCGSRNITCGDGWVAPRYVPLSLDVFIFGPNSYL